VNRARAIEAFLMLLDALEEEAPARPEQSKYRAKRLPVRPAAQVDEVTAARARAILRGKGFRDG